MCEGWPVEDRIVRFLQPRVASQWLAGVGIHVEARKVAAGNVQPDAVSLREDVTGGVHLNG